MLPMVPSSEGHENFPEAVPVIAEIPLVLPSSEGCRKLGTTRTTVWFTVEYCQTFHHVNGVSWSTEDSVTVVDSGLVCILPVAQKTIGYQ